MTARKQANTTSPVDMHGLFARLPQRYILIQANDPDFTFLEVSDGHLELTGKRRDEIIGHNFFEVFPDVSEEYKRTGVSQIELSLRRVITTKKADPLGEFRYDIPDGKGDFVEKYWRPIHYPILGDDGNVIYILQSSEDVTEERQAAQELSAIERRLDDALRIGQVGSWVWDVENDKVVADQHLANLFGMPVQTGSVELPLDNFVEAIHPEDRARVTKSIDHAVRNGDNFEEEYRTISASGETRWVIARGRIERNKKGKAVSFPGVIVDITERKQAEARYTEQLALTNTIAVSLAEGVYALDNEGKVIFVNPAAERMLGWKEDEIIGKPIHDIVHFRKPDGTPRPASECRMLKSLQTKRPVQEAETNFIRKDGSSFTISYSAVPIKQDKKVIGVVQSFTDISERKQAEANLRFLANASTVLASSLDYKKTLRSLAKLAVPTTADWCAVDLVDADGQLQQVALAHSDPARVAWATRLRSERQVNLEDDTGVPNVIRSGEAEFYPEVPLSLLQARAKTPQELKLLTELSFNSVIIVPLNLQDRTVGAVTFVRSQGDRRYDQADFIMAKELGNRASLAMTNARLYQTVRSELEERERLEAELRDINEELENRVAQRTAQLQETNTNLERSNQELQDFAYVASHDLQEPLRKIQAFSNLLSNEYAAQLGDGQDYLDRMKNAAARMSSLIEDLLSFSRVTTKAHPFQTVDLNDVAYEVVGDLETRIEETGGTVDIKELPTVQADPMQMRQLLQNLIGNALKFSRPGVTPEVTVSATSHSEGGTIKEYVLTVADNGIGFDEKYLDRIFAVFQRLHGREQYQGTGIGLAICRKIAERHGGTITARSVLGKGARFIITLPVNHKESA